MLGGYRLWMEGLLYQQVLIGVWCLSCGFVMTGFEYVIFGLLCDSN